MNLNDDDDDDDDDDADDADDADDDNNDDDDNDADDNSQDANQKQVYYFIHSSLNFEFYRIYNIYYIIFCFIPSSNHKIIKLTFF